MRISPAVTRGYGSPVMLHDLQRPRGDSVKLFSALAVIPILIFSLYGFLATFEAVPLDEAVTSWRMVQRVICGAALLASFCFMGWLAFPSRFPGWRSVD